MDWTIVRRAPATLAALTCTGVGITYNAGFAEQFGTAAVALAVASDVLKTCAGPALTAAIGERQWIRATASALVLVVTLTVSLVAAFGSAQHNRETATDDRAGKMLAYDSAAADVTRLDKELGALGTPRPVDVIMADIQGAKIDMGIWRRSKQCADITRAESKAACQPILALYRERGAAARRSELEPQLTAAKTVLATIGPRPQNADPQAHALSLVTGLPEDTIRLAISALIVALIEVGAIGGAIMAARPVTPRSANDNTPPLASVATTVASRATVVGHGNCLDATVATVPCLLGSARLAPSIVATTVASKATVTVAKPEAWADLQALLATGAIVPSQDLLVARWGQAPDRVSKWLLEWERDGVICRARDGRHKVIRAA